MAKINFAKLSNKFNSGKDFILTRQQYINAVGKDIPQDKRYTETKSAISKEARSYGYTINVVPEKLVFSKVR